MADDGVSSDFVDLINSFPDEILHRILSSIETIFAIRTSVLSKRWRHMWSETPSLIFDNPEADLINQTLANYKAPKMTSFQLCTRTRDHVPHIDGWIEFAMSRNVENMLLNINFFGYNNYTIPDVFYTNSSLKQLKVNLGVGLYDMMIPTGSVSWRNRAADSINQTLANYKAPKMTSFQLCTRTSDHIDGWIEFAMSRNVENMSLDINSGCSNINYTIPDFFYTNSSLKQLRVNLGFYDLMIPNHSVSWTSLKKLTLGSSKLSDEIFAKIISGCSILESLRLFFCDRLKILDLRNSLHLRTLEIYQGSMKIVAPHVHYLNLTNSGVPCRLLDVSSLTKARLDIHCCSSEVNLRSDFLECMVLKLLEKMEHVDKLTLGRSFLEILSLAELRGVTFPSLKVKELTVETIVSQYVIPGLVRVLQNSPELKKLTIHTMESPTLSDKDKHRDTSLQYLSDFSSCDWRSKLSVFKNVFRKNLESKHVASFMELMLESTKSTLENMVLILDGYLDGKRFEELLEMVPSLSQDNNVFIVLIR